MIINYYGGDYFKIQAGDLAILIDPENQRSFKGATLALNTIRPSLAEAPLEASPAWIDHQGEYEVNGIRVEGRTLGEEEKRKRRLIESSSTRFASAFWAISRKIPIRRCRSF